MENGKISNKQVSSSSQLSSAYSGSKARLNGNAVWTPKPYDQNKRLVINFIVETIICSISTQGRPNKAEFVLNYTVSHRNEGETFIKYMQNGIEKVRINISHLP